jgi:hypothetical protein
LADGRLAFPIGDGVAIVTSHLGCALRRRGWIASPCPS